MESHKTKSFFRKLTKEKGICSKADEIDEWYPQSCQWEWHWNFSPGELLNDTNISCRKKSLKGTI